MLGELLDRGSDRPRVVGNDPALDVEALVGEQGGQRLTARVLARALVDAVRDRQDGGVQRGSFVFETSVTSVIVIALSTAFAMS